MVKVKKEIIKKEYIQQKSKRFVKKKRAKESFQEGMDVASTFEGPGPGPDTFEGVGMV
jgi:hypothetical protein